MVLYWLPVQSVLLSLLFVKVNEKRVISTIIILFRVPFLRLFLKIFFRLAFTQASARDSATRFFMSQDLCSMLASDWKILFAVWIRDSATRFFVSQDLCSTFSAKIVNFCPSLRMFNLEDHDSCMLVFTHAVLIVMWEQ